MPVWSQYLLWNHFFLVGLIAKELVLEGKVVPAHLKKTKHLCCGVIVNQLKSLMTAIFTTSSSVPCSDLSKGEFKNDFYD